MQAAWCCQGEQSTALSPCRDSTRSTGQMYLSPRDGVSFSPGCRVSAWVRYLGQKKSKSPLVRGLTAWKVGPAAGLPLCLVSYSMACYLLILPWLCLIASIASVTYWRGGDTSYGRGEGGNQPIDLSWSCQKALGRSSNPACPLPAQLLSSPARLCLAIAGQQDVRWPHGKRESWECTHTEGVWVSRSPGAVKQTRAKGFMNSTWLFITSRYSPWVSCNVSVTFSALSSSDFPFVLN